ncbi:6411_t:CDS:2 [Funneliformis caledonium]|uniref:6411_t:CDS:1 n=1 Tax=Funneliformis caledonium TaxID=1117310 RepID=A0A9N9D7E1_9GLOM|nr:6411_t:CDS:2 [Funneliformis caledonium]
MIRNFEIAAEANNWSKACMLKIVSGYLYELAAYWFEENNDTINRWNKDRLYKKLEFYVGKFKRLLKKVESSSTLLNKYTVRLFLNGLRKNIIPFVVFSHSKNVDEAIEAAKQVESGQYYEQQSPVLTQTSESNNTIDNFTKQMKQLSLNNATLPNVLSMQFEGKSERRKPKDDRNLIKVWDKKDLEVERKRQSESRRKLNLRSRKPINEFIEVETPQIITPTLKKKVK